MLQRVGRFYVVRLKGGKQRAVFLVEEADTGQVAVLKQYTSGAEAVREYEVLHTCSGDPRIVSLIDFFEVEGLWCILTEYVDGVTLDALMADRGALPPRKVIDLAIDILNGVAHVHAQGYIHGDLHGNNVMVTDFDRARVKIIDFQHAVRKLSTGKAAAIRRVERRRLAPECKSGMIDERFDLYSVGYMCACLLTGVVKLGKVPGNGSPRWWAGSHPLWKVIRKAMQPDPEQRYRTAQEMIAALEGLKSRS